MLRENFVANHHAVLVLQIHGSYYTGLCNDHTPLVGAVGVPFVFVNFFFFSSRRRHTRFKCDWSSDVCSSDLLAGVEVILRLLKRLEAVRQELEQERNRALKQGEAP